mmetsp:Transcript_92661/g.246161  ORF Transcript_92661/g.246161 Transcript_92661/m.246161 type:complete len:300 (+) Transcript_92661:155-1054(+)
MAHLRSGRGSGLLPDVPCDRRPFRGASGLARDHGRLGDEKLLGSFQPQPPADLGARPLVEHLGENHDAEQRHALGGHHEHRRRQATAPVYPECAAGRQREERARRGDDVHVPPHQEHRRHHRTPREYNRQVPPIWARINECGCCYLRHAAEGHDGVDRVDVPPGDQVGPIQRGHANAPEQDLRNFLQICLALLPRREHAHVEGCCWKRNNASDLAERLQVFDLVGPNPLLHFCRQGVVCRALPRADGVPDRPQGQRCLPERLVAHRGAPEPEQRHRRDDPVDREHQHVRGGEGGGCHRG